jgi:hypothetical protein
MQKSVCYESESGVGNNAPSMVVACGLIMGRSGHISTTKVLAPLCTSFENNETFYLTHISYPKSYIPYQPNNGLPSFLVEVCFSLLGLVQIPTVDHRSWPSPSRSSGLHKRLDQTSCARQFVRYTSLEV